MTSLIYLDNSTTTKPSEKAISAMMPFWTNYWGIPSAPHQKGQELYPFIGEYYKNLYQLLGADEEDSLILTSSGTEAVNHVVSSVYRDVTLSTGKNHFLSGALDEAASIIAMSHLEPFGCLGRVVSVDAQGKVTAESLADCLSPRTALLSISCANGLTGVIQPLVEIAALCKQRGVRLHLDATHVLGKLYFDFQEIGADYISFNGDHLHAPKGCGALYIKKGIKCSPLLFGSADQAGMRAGGLNVPSLAALSFAAKEAMENRDLVCTEVARLRNQLEQGVTQAIPKSIICFKEQERLPHCTTLLFPGLANEAILYALNRRGLCASIGGGSFQQLGLMLCSTGMDPLLAHSAVSFSLSRYTTENEIERAIVIISEVVHSLNRLSFQSDVLGESFQ